MAFSIPTKEIFSKNMYTDECQAFEAIYGIKKKPSRNGESKPEAGDSLFVSMRGYLIFGRFVGIIPVSGVFSPNYTSLYFKMLSLPVVVSLVISTLVGFTTILAVLETIGYPKSNALEIARSIQGTVFKVWGLFSYLYFLARASGFINIFKSWGKSSLFYNVNDKTLRRDIIVISMIIIISTLTESTLLHLEYFPQFDNINGLHGQRNLTFNSTLETYYVRSHGHWRKLLGYHPILAILGFVSHKFVLICWNYVDLTLIIFARALYFKFKALCSVAQENLQAYKESSDLTPFSLADRLTWTHIAKDHDTLCMLLEAFEKFLSPLIFGSYATNIYYICMQLIDGLTPEKVDDSWVHSIFAPVSFLILILRVFLLSISAARINTYAHEIGSILKKCPIELYDAEVQRVDKHVTAGPDIGLSGLGCFIVTKPFILSILNVIFTVEIVLLQGLSSGMPATCSSKPSR